MISVSTAKMRLVNIVGPIHDFDRVVGKYLLDGNIHLEQATSVVSSVKGLYNFEQDNPYDAVLKRAYDILDQVGGSDVKFEKSEILLHMIIDGTAVSYIDRFFSRLEHEIQQELNEKQSVTDELAEINELQKQLGHLLGLDVELDRLFHLEFVKFRYGRLPRSSYQKLETYINDLTGLFIPVEEDADYVWGMYFAPVQHEEKLDSVFSSLYFERIRISDKIKGVPKQSLKELTKRRLDLTSKLNKINQDIKRHLKDNSQEFAQAYSTLKLLQASYDVRKYAAHTDESFYIVGWMTKADADKLNQRLEQDSFISVVVEEPEMVPAVKPPTILQNPRIFRPFEEFVGMYGLPAYNEFDPTVFMSVIYVLLFGIMFGDMGHGVVLFLVGLVMWKWRGMNLGKILMLAGVPSTIFGFLYGSIFGNETLIKSYVIHPMENSQSMNFMLIATVGMGVVLIVAAMAINIINGIKNKEIGKALFDPNGVAGLLFYLSIIGAVVYFFLTGKNVLTVAFILIFVVLPLILMFLEEPLSKLLQRKKDWVPHHIGEYILETFFELFEVILSYITNTISFVRVGAFALNHVGMLMVVMMFMEMTHGAGSLLVGIIGNIVVIALEGLIVGIQVLRLMFYELFSRFFAGDGKEFHPLKVD